MIDENCYATDRQAFTTCIFFAKKLGILVGGSAGGVIYNAVHYAYKNNDNVAVVVPDGGEKYLGTVYSESWVKDRKLFDKKTYNQLEDRILCH